MKKILVFIVAYEAEAFIVDVFDRIAKQIKPDHYYQILMIDDSSKDKTFEIAQQYAEDHPALNILNLYNPINQGYGGNQQIGYQYGIDNGFDVVILLHGDGQYPPELINEMAEPILNSEYDVMLGSRMLNKKDALDGGMPLYKWLGNQTLTWLENKMLHQKLAEYHTGFRAYSISTLRSIPLSYNSKYYDFDTDILIQMSDINARIGEIPIPTKYGDEICRVNGIKYGILILKSCLQSRIMRLGLFYNPKFDYTLSANTPKEFAGKFGYNSSHQKALDSVNSGMNILDLGSGPGYMAEKLHEKGIKVTSVDIQTSERLTNNSDAVVQLDLNFSDLSEIEGKFDGIFLLDILEQMDDAESLLMCIRDRFAPDMPKVFISIGNVAFFITRFSLLFGKFNYGRLGILDMDKKRLFTLGSIKRVLRDNGFKIESISGIPAPYHKATGNNVFSSFLQVLNRGLIHLSKGMFSYQIFITAYPTLTVEQLLENAKQRK